MPAYKKGAFVIKNSEGTVALNGLATLTNDVMNAGWRDVTEIMQHKDAGNVLRTMTKDMNVFQCQLTLTPGIGSALANQAAVAAAIASLRKGMQIITGAFEDADFIIADASKAIITDIGKTLSQGNLMSVDVTVEYYTDTAGTVIDFTGAWASL